MEEAEGIDHAPANGQVDVLWAEMPQGVEEVLDPFSLVNAPHEEEAQLSAGRL